MKTCIANIKFYRQKINHKFTIKTDKMKQKFIILTIFLVFASQLTYSQIIGIPETNSMMVKKIAGSDLLIPIKIGFLNTGTAATTSTVLININNTYTNLINQFSAADLANIRILNNNQTLSINPGVTANATNVFYLFVDRSVIVNCDKIIYLGINEGANILSTIKITIQEDEQLFNLTQYLNAANVLDYVTKVESAGNILTVYGYKTITSNSQTMSVFLKRNVALGNEQVLAVNEWNWIFNRAHWQPVPFSIITIPFKIRPQITVKSNDFKTSASSGITSLGFNIDLGKYQMDRYFATGKKSSHKFSLGFWAAPAVEEVDSVYTSGYLAKDDKSKQLFISTGLTISYSYNDISFVFVPAGWDIGTTSIGKNWVYNGQRWWGFGLAISPKIFATILNK